MTKSHKCPLLSTRSAALRVAENNLQVPVAVGSPGDSSVTLFLRLLES